MTYAVSLGLHVLSAVVWIGGMFFAWVCLRPSLAEVLEGPQAPKLLAASLGRFFRWVWVAVVLLLVTGFHMTFTRYGFGAWPGWLLVMMSVGMFMMALAAHVYFAPLKRLKRGLAAGDLATVKPAAAQIRRIVGVNLFLGLGVVLAATAGRYW